MDTILHCLTIAVHFLVDSNVLASYTEQRNCFIINFWFHFV